MKILFRILEVKEIQLVIPLVYQLNKGKVENQVLFPRFAEMVIQNYQCVGIFNAKK